MWSILCTWNGKNGEIIPPCTVFIWDNGLEEIGTLPAVVVVFRSHLEGGGVFTFEKQFFIATLWLQGIQAGSVGNPDAAL